MSEQSKVRQKVTITIKPELVRALDRIIKQQERFNVSRSNMIETLLLEHPEVQKNIKVKNL